MHLVPCPSCQRHVKNSEAACPFCSASLSGKTISRTPAVRRRLERLAAFTFAASLAVTGCAVAGDEDTEKSEQDLGGVHAMYGMPPPPPVDAGGGKDEDAGAPCDEIEPTDPDNGGFHAMYGMPAWPTNPCPPAEDAGSPDPDPEPFDAGGFHTMYGMPPAK